MNKMMEKKMHEIMERQMDYVRSRGGYVNICEADDTYNSLNREWLKAARLAWGQLYLGSVYPIAEKDGKKLFCKKVGDAEKYCNFCGMFAVTSDDPTLYELLVKWNNVGLKKSVSLWDEIADRIRYLGGELLTWY